MSDTTITYTFQGLDPLHELQTTTGSAFACKNATYKVELVGLDEPRDLVRGLLQALTWMDFQYSGPTYYSPFYTSSPLKTLELFRCNKSVEVLDYYAVAVILKDESMFYFYNDADNGLRPISYEYRLFLGKRGIFGKKFNHSFFTAVQRTVYEWLSNITVLFELSGRLTMDVFWTYSHSKICYILRKCKIQMEFDIRKKSVAPTGNINWHFHILLHEPSHFQKSYIVKSDFLTEGDYYSWFQTRRILNIERHIEDTLCIDADDKVHCKVADENAEEINVTSLYCYEDASELPE